MNINYQPAGDKDIPILLLLMQEFYILEHLPYNSDILTESLHKLFSNESYGRLWIISQNSEALGYILVTFGFSLEFHGVDALVDEFYIREGFRGKGIGKHTLKFVEDYLASAGIKAFHLEVDRVNSIAQETYRKFGFKDHDRYLLTKWITRLD